MLFISGISFSQDMFTPPGPLDNPFLVSTEGTWISEPYELMGGKWIDEYTFSWTLNHQFLEMRIKTSSTDGKMTFNSYGIMSADNEGNYKCWTFDDFGYRSAGIFIGKISGNRLTMAGGTMISKGEMTIVVDGGKMTEEAIMYMKDAEGKDQTMKVRIVSNKK